MRPSWLPPEWAPHRATWLSWPRNADTWPGDRLERVQQALARFVAVVATGEEVCLNVHPELDAERLHAHLLQAGADLGRVRALAHPTNDAWCRDHGPITVRRKAPSGQPEWAMLNWGFNSWGGKYPPWDDDDQIPARVAAYRNLPMVAPGLVLEGGAIETNGQGLLMATPSSVVSATRNPGVDQPTLEAALKYHLGVEDILWLHNGLAGDDTDGHIDNLARFVAPYTVVATVAGNANDPDAPGLRANVEALRAWRGPAGEALTVVELPLPANPVVQDGQRLPASYANFYIANAAVVVPTFRQASDAEAIAILQDLVPDRPVLGLDAWDVIWGLGSWHCLSMQEPAI